MSHSTQPLQDEHSTQGLFFNAPDAEGKDHVVNKAAVQKFSHYVNEYLKKGIRSLQVSIK